LELTVQSLEEALGEKDQEINCLRVI